MMLRALFLRYSVLTHPKYSVRTHPKYSMIITHLKYSVLTHPKYSVLTHPKYFVLTHSKYSVLTHYKYYVLTYQLSIIGTPCSSVRDEWVKINCVIVVICNFCYLAMGVVLQYYCNNTRRSLIMHMGFYVLCIWDYLVYLYY